MLIEIKYWLLLLLLHIMHKMRQVRYFSVLIFANIIGTHIVGFKYVIFSEKEVFYYKLKNKIIIVTGNMRVFRHSNLF